MLLEPLEVHSVPAARERSGPEPSSPSNDEFKHDHLTALGQCPSLAYQPGFLALAQADTAFAYFEQQHPWPESTFTMAGRQFHLPRRQTWHADPGVVYSYSNNLLTATPWTPILLAIKQQVERAVGHPFNAVLVNRYDGQQQLVDWHSDDDREMGPNPVIASVTLGAERPFSFRPRRDASIQGAQTGAIVLQHGSLLVMQPEFQHQYEHALLPLNKPCATRINLTFRWVIKPN